jgi:hypothetical protein
MKINIKKCFKFIKLQACRHQSSHIFKINFFSYIFCLNILILICNKNNIVTFFFPSIFFDPRFQRSI